MFSTMSLKLLTIIFLITIPYFCASQEGICSGNLGENIFTKGDFGSGVDPVLLTDPMIAPEYNYSGGVVPFDGSYTVCSRTNALNGLYGTWLNISDNSNDPTGYMMVVNASYEPGIFYEETVDGLCENTLYEFSADLINIVKIGVPGHSDPNVSFLIDDVTQYTTGNIPKIEAWGKYGFSFVTGMDQTSLKLTIRNNAPGGTGNDLALDNISFRPCGPASFIGIENEEETIFLCIDDEPLTVLADIDSDDGTTFDIQWQSSLDSENWTDMLGEQSQSITHSNFDPGDYYYRYLSAGSENNLQNVKCRIISDVIKITILPDTYSVNDTICDGLIYEFGSQQLFQNGLYTEAFQSNFGCDSVVLLDLFFAEELPFFIEVDLVDPSCFDFEDGSISVLDLSGGYGGISSQIYDTGENEVVGNVSAGEYSIILEDRFSCIEEYKYILNNPDSIFVDIGQDTILRFGQDVNIVPQYSESTSFENYSWSANGVIDCTDCPSINYLPYENGQLTLTAIDENGCMTSDNMFFNIDDGETIFLPNIFSPNGDRINDEFTFGFYARSVAIVESFVVYDRWGHPLKVVKNEPASMNMELWDGYYNGKTVSSGVYSYVLRYKLINNQIKTTAGMVTVIH